MTRTLDQSSKAEKAKVTDPFSDVLRSFRLSGAIFLDSHFTAPWCIVSKLTAEDCGPLLTAPSLLIAYHFVIEGSFLLTIEGEPTVEVRAGEVVLLPRNDVHTLASGSGMAPVDAHDLIHPTVGGGLAQISHGGGGEKTHIVCGFLSSEDQYSPLIGALPRILKLDVRQGTWRDWVDASVRFAATELTQGRFASSGAMSRLSELLFVEAVRQYAATPHNQGAGWLRALSDPHVGQAIALMHRNIGTSWSAEGLAKEVSMSRSAFVHRFTSLTGMPPIRYLTVWRLQTAKLHLRETQKTIAQLAYSVGYDSEAAFSRAFKREFGLAPARWREQHLLQ
jgi:AraC-like DNA-binding protein